MQKYSITNVGLLSQKIREEGDYNMKDCPKCHKPVEDTANFCNNCGFHFDSTQVPPQEPAVYGGLHCPYCKSKNINYVLENVGSVGSARRVTNKVAFGSSSNINKKYWKCKNCGREFDDIQNVEDRIKALGVSKVIIVAIAVIMSVLYMAASIGGGSFGSGMISILVVYALVYVILRLLEKKKRNINEKLAWLKENCFDKN